MVSESPNRVELAVELDGPGLLVLRDYYDPAWRATATDGQGRSRTLPVWRANRVMRAVHLEGGSWTVRFDYRPTGAWIGGAISLAAWLGIAALAVVNAVRRGTRENGSGLFFGHPARTARDARTEKES